MERALVQWTVNSHCFEQPFRLCDFLVQSHCIGKHKRVDAFGESCFSGTAICQGEVRLGVQTANFLVYLFELGKLLLRNPVPGKGPRNSREVPEHRDSLGCGLGMTTQTEGTADTLDICSSIVERVEEVNAGEAIN
ncbi:hypothetical protein ATCV1_z260R [Acanthocystis turfacea chlorella virus 1]|uniref:Uncharacterized protein z260R n=1 Tax=Chlorovirus heliozoae TaxID=322019 RepID=A7K8M0_9PHYC|nr:hypothetical protein ATCV1_z260R [Acanthocystis turfacea chlorella virus 1]ABT16394.1 hypothetical protein ATCV1_z260R [Acanthocystis turfacea chlorella virus 1]